MGDFNLFKRRAEVHKHRAERDFSRKMNLRKDKIEKEKYKEPQGKIEKAEQWFKSKKYEKGQWKDRQAKREKAVEQFADYYQPVKPLLDTLDHGLQRYEKYHQAIKESSNIPIRRLAQMYYHLDKYYQKVDKLEARTDLKKFLNEKKRGMEEVQKQMEDLNQNVDNKKKFGPYSNTIVECMKKEHTKITRLINHLKDTESANNEIEGSSSINPLIIEKSGGTGLDSLKKELDELSVQISNKIIESKEDIPLTKGTETEIDNTKTHDQQLKQAAKDLKDLKQLRANPKKYQQLLYDLDKYNAPFNKYSQIMKNKINKIQRLLNEKYPTDDVTSIWLLVTERDKIKSGIDKISKHIQMKPEEKIILHIIDINKTYQDTYGNNDLYSKKAEKLLDELEESIKGYNPYYHSEQYAQDPKPIDADLPGSCGVWSSRWILRELGKDIEHDATEARVANLVDLGYDKNRKQTKISGTVSRNLPKVFEAYGLKAERSVIDSFEDIKKILQKGGLILAFLGKRKIGDHAIAIGQAFGENNEDRVVITADPMHPNGTRRALYEEIDGFLAGDCLRVYSDKSNTEEE